jgi:hypothetical protein
MYLFKDIQDYKIDKNSTKLTPKKIIKNDIDIKEPTKPRNKRLPTNIIIINNVNTNV